MADLTTLTAELAGMKQKMVDRLVAQGDETIQPDDTMQTIVDHFDNLRTKIVNQDKEITANGEYTADEGYTGLGKVTVDVKAEPVPKYGATVDSFLGDVDANGVLQKPTKKMNLVFDGIKNIAERSLNYAFANTSSVESVDFPDLEQVDGTHAVANGFSGSTSVKSFKADKLKTINGSYAFYYLFNYCNSIISISFAELETINVDDAFRHLAANSSSLQSYNFNKLKVINGQSIFYSAFQSTKQIEIAAFPSLEEITKGNGTFQNAFNYSTKLHTVFFPKLRRVAGQGAFYSTFSSSYDIIKVNFDSLESLSDNTTTYMFSGCNKLPKISFPSLTTFKTIYELANNMFVGCTLLTEIHFRADAQTTIEAQSNYSSKFGATNATIYFDLIGTITVNGVAYARNEPNSIYVEYDKTYVAWADESGNIVYTTAGAEPAVGTVVYSDEGTTQVGTVSAVA